MSAEVPVIEKPEHRVRTPEETDEQIRRIADNLGKRAINFEETTRPEEKHFVRVRPTIRRPTEYVREYDTGDVIVNTSKGGNVTRIGVSEEITKEITDQSTQSTDKGSKSELVSTYLEDIDKDDVGIRSSHHQVFGKNGFGHTHTIAFGTGTNKAEHYTNDPNDEAFGGDTLTLSVEEKRTLAAKKLAEVRRGIMVATERREQAREEVRQRKLVEEDKIRAQKAKKQADVLAKFI